MTSLGVQKLLESLTVNKASGPHGVPTYLLRELSHELAPILASLFQQSLDQGQLPNDWIKANVVPILKKGKRSLASNNRPLSLTSVRSKILEHITVYVIIFGSNWKIIMCLVIFNMVSTSRGIVKPNLWWQCSTSLVQWTPRNRLIPLH